MPVNVLLLHLDGTPDRAADRVRKYKFPNLALMKLLAHHRALGHEVELREVQTAEDLQPRLSDPRRDLVYGSLIFEWTRPLALAARHIYPDIVLGGTGWDFKDGVQVGRTDLPPAAEDIVPDYSGYPGYQRSIGFTQRGCRYECDFCVVPRKEGKVRAVGTFEQIWRGEPYPKQLVILDNDFFGNPDWTARLEEAARNDFDLSLIQGINARLLSDRAAAALATARLRDDDFERPRIYTAWDGRKDERVLFRGLERLVKYGVRPDNIMVYMLIGHEPGETHEDRDYRRQKLREFGARPYPMPFTREGMSPSGTDGEELVAFQRWVIMRIDLVKTWEEYWGRARGNPRKLGKKGFSLPLWGD